MSSTTRPRHWLASGLLLGSLLVLGVVMLVPRTEADALTYVALASGLVLGLTALLTFVGIQVRRLVGRIQPADEVAALRQGLELAVLSIGIAFLRATNGMTAWEIGLLVAVLVFAEVTFALRHRRAATQAGAA